MSTPHIYTRRHIMAWDKTAVADPAHRRIIQDALNVCDYPFGRIRRNTGKRVPVSVSDLSRFNTISQHDGHSHVVIRNGEEAHALVRETALGLYWLPTTTHPAGRVELEITTLSDPDLAREVFLAEAAHAVDYGVPITDEQRRAIFAAYHSGSGDEHGDHGWFEERGGQDYWGWVGESFMAGFMHAFAPTLPRPLEARQPWAHPTTDAIAAEIRKTLL